MSLEVMSSARKTCQEVLFGGLPLGLVTHKETFTLLKTVMPHGVLGGVGDVRARGSGKAS